MAKKEILPEGHVKVEVLIPYEEFKKGEVLIIPERRFKSEARRKRVKLWKAKGGKAK